MIKGTHILARFVAGTFGLMSILALSGCYLFNSPEEMVEKNLVEIESEFQETLREQIEGRDGGELKVTWNQALEKMYMENPQLLQADFRVEDAIEQKKRIYKNFIPLVSVGVSDSFEISDLGDAFDDINFRVFSFLPLGEIVRLPKNIYTQQLRYIGTQLAAEQTMRQEVIALYRLFQQQYLLELENYALTLEGKLTEGLIGLEDADAIRMREAFKQSVEAYNERYKEWKERVSDFYMSDYDDIDLKRRTLPDITYDPDDLDFTDSRRWGMLQLNLLALERISKDARVIETYLRYFPRPNFNVSAPPLFTDNANQSFDPGEIRLGPSLNWSLDTRGVIGEQLERIKREEPLSDWREDRRRRTEIRQLLEGKEQLEEVQADLVKIRKVMDGYRKAVKQGLVPDPQKAVRTMRSLREREVRLAAQEIEICTTFWLLDEKRWTKITKRWQETRKIRYKQRKAEREAKEKAEGKKWLW